MFGFVLTRIAEVPRIPHGKRLMNITKSFLDLIRKLNLLIKFL